MKKIVAILTAVLMVAVLLVACSPAPAASEEPSAPAAAEAAAPSEAASEAPSEAAASEAPKSDLVFADLAYNMADVWNQYDVEAFKWAAEQKGVTVKVSDAQNDPEKQVTQAQEFINQGVDGMVVFPCTPESAATIVRMANEAEIPIAIENIFLSEEAAKGVVGQVACQYRDIGYAAIKYAADNFAGCKLLYVHGGAGLGVYEDYKIGVDKALEEFKDKVTMVGLIDGKWATEPSQNVTQDFITSGKSEFDIVFANNGLQAVGVYNALKDNGMEKIPIISTGGSMEDLDMMQKGIEYANMTAPVNIQGVISFRFLWQAVNKAEIKETKIPLPIIPIDKNNMNEWIRWDDYQAAYDFIGGITP